MKKKLIYPAICLRLNAFFLDAFEKIESLDLSERLKSHSNCEQGFYENVPSLTWPF